jgi:hypothetical protein
MVMAYLCAQLLPWVRGRKVSVQERGGSKVREGKGREFESRDAEDVDMRMAKMFFAKCCAIQE